MLGLTISRDVNLSVASIACCPANCRRSYPASSWDGVRSRTYRWSSLGDSRRGSGSFRLRCSSGRFGMLRGITGSEKETYYDGCDRNRCFHKRSDPVRDWLGFDVAFSVAKAKCKSSQSTICWRWNVSMVSQAPSSRPRFVLASLRCWECAESVALFSTFGD